MSHKKYSASNIPMAVTKDHVIFIFFFTITLWQLLFSNSGHTNLYSEPDVFFYRVTLTVFNREVESMFSPLESQWTFVTMVTNRI